MELGLVEVVIPTFNQVDTICSAIDSVLNQDYCHLLIHVFDDCSTDGTWERISEMYSGLGYDKIRLYRNSTNVGHPVDSILQSNIEFLGEFWCYLEGDDYLSSDHKISRQVEALQQRADLAGVSSICHLQNEQTGERTTIQPDVQEWNFRDLVFESNRFAFYVHISSVMWRNFSSKFGGSVFPPSLNKLSQKSEVALHHCILLETGMNFRHLEFYGSTYRYSGKGIWSSKSEEEQRAMNSKQKIELDGLVPIWYKVFYRFEKNVILGNMRPRRYRTRLSIVYR